MHTYRGVRLCRVPTAELEEALYREGVWVHDSSEEPLTPDEVASVEAQIVLELYVRSLGLTSDNGRS